MRKCKTTNAQRKYTYTHKLSAKICIHSTRIRLPYTSIHPLIKSYNTLWLQYTRTHIHKCMQIIYTYNYITHTNRRPRLSSEYTYIHDIDFNFKDCSRTAKIAEVQVASADERNMSTVLICSCVFVICCLTTLAKD